MRIDRFEDILVWQKSKNLAKEIYLCFNDSKDFGFRDQIQRSAVSVMNNIAEGFERRTNNEFIQFLYIAKGLSGEVCSMLILALELDKIGIEDYNRLFSMAEEISKMNAGLIKTL